MAPPLWSARAPRWPEESVPFDVDALLYAYKLAPDQDVHLIIADEQGWMMVAEIPHPNCAANPAAREVIANARAALISMLPKPPSSGLRELVRPVRLRLRGMLFFDESHSQTGSALNGVELHPVVAIEPL